MKRCPKCGRTKKLSEFNTSKNRYDGVSGHCKDCKKLYRLRTVNHINKMSKLWRQAKGKDEYLQLSKYMSRLKINGCAICGYDKCGACLEFHHVNPEDKKFGVNVSNLKHSNEKVLNELNKCILLCNRCHREIHNEFKSS